MHGPTKIRVSSLAVKDTTNTKEIFDTYGQYKLQKILRSGYEDMIFKSFHN